jgi:hypothetical protein
MQLGFPLRKFQAQGFDAIASNSDSDFLNDSHGGRSIPSIHAGEKSAPLLFCCWEFGVLRPAMRSL